MQSEYAGELPIAEDGLLTTSAPILDLPDAEALILRSFNIKAQATLLASERDLNFKLVAENGQTYLLKVANPAECPQVINLQTRALEHIALVAPHLPVPHIVYAADKAAEVTEVLSDGRGSVVRLLTYLDGEPLYKLPHTRAQRTALGRCAAQLDQALTDFSHPMSEHDLLWNISQAHKLDRLIDKLSGDRRRKLARHFMTGYQERALPRLHGLRKQVIHNDLNLHNILACADDVSKITGIIDFGDMVYAPLVNESATAAAYQLNDPDDPLGSAAEFLAGYHSQMPLLVEELEIIVDLMAARLLITVLITEWRANRYPANRTYIMRNNPAAWAGLAYLADFSPAAARDSLLRHCKTGYSE